MDDRAQRCLVVGPSWVGDMVMAQSLFMDLKRHHPDLTIDVLAPAWSEPLLRRMPEVAHSISMPVGHGKLQLGVRRQIARTLRADHYDWSILLPNSFKSALIPYWAKIPRRTGYQGEMRFGLVNDMRRLNKQLLPMTVQRFVALGLEADAELPPHCPSPELDIDQDEVRETLAHFGFEAGDAVLALCPGAEYGPAKRWPAEHFARIAKAKLDDGWQVWVFGSERDREAADALCAQAGEGCVNLAGRTTLSQAIDLMSCAAAVVTNDSGLMHIAAAMDLPLIALYGSSDPHFTPPLSATARIERLGLECSPCFKRTCPLGHTRCLYDLEPERVLRTLDSIVP